MLDNNPACSLQTCTALFSGLLAANLHTVFPKTLGIYLAIDSCSFLRQWRRKMFCSRGAKAVNSALVRYCKQPRDIARTASQPITSTYTASAVACPKQSTSVNEGEQEVRKLQAMMLHRAPSSSP